MLIKTIQDFGKALRDGPYTSVGSYPVFFLTSDGAALSFATVWEERSLIAESINKKLNDGWRVVAVDVNWEDSNLVDDHSGNRIESAYAEDGAEGEVDEIPDSYRLWQIRTMHADALRSYLRAGGKMQEAAEAELRRRGIRAA